ncbi:MAG: endonuclease/exonuclease/phosphatase family protein [Phycisphaerales bacterium]|nr:endonuclease/exonuclease/phosphatase family protein [Phycisphaerales bacterium]
MRRIDSLLSILGVACGLACVPAAMAQVRIGQWNVTNWNATDVAARGAAFQTAFYGINPANALQFAPDLMILQEIEDAGGQGNVNAFVNVLNTAPGSPGDWVAAPFVLNQGDSSNALVYRSTRFTYVTNSVITLGVQGVDVGSGPTQAPRDNQRWTMLPFGYSGSSANLYIYSSHMKAGDTGADQLRREPEGLRIRANANTLPTGSHFLLGGDFNIQSSSQVAYQYMTAFNSMFADARNVQSGQFFDPINRPGDWNGNCSFRNIHTQEPTGPGTGGMDDRLDQILVSSALRDGQGWSYIPFSPGGNILLPFVSAAAGCPSSTTATAWFDANHSYRAFGNDGNHFNGGIVDGNFNTQVGVTIAQALITTVATGGHLPVYLDLQVPAKLGSPTGTIAFGSVPQNSTTTQAISITNAADVARFSKNGTGWGIDTLNYSFSFVSGSGFSIQGGNGPFTRSATALPAQANSHTIVVDTSAQGTLNAVLRITSDDPDAPTRDIALTATVGSGGPPPPPPGNYDVNGDGQFTIEDLYRWYNLFTDVDQNTVVDINDALALRRFLRWYEMQEIINGRR